MQSSTVTQWTETDTWCGHERVGDKTGTPLSPTAASQAGFWEPLGVQPAQTLPPESTARGSPVVPGHGEGPAARPPQEPGSATAASRLQEPPGPHSLGRVIHLLSRKNRENQQLITPPAQAVTRLCRPRRKHRPFPACGSGCAECRARAQRRCRRRGCPRGAGSALFDEEESPSGGCLFL